MEPIKIKEIDLTSLFHFGQGYGRIREECVLENPADFTADIFAEIAGTCQEYEKEIGDSSDFYNFEICRYYPEPYFTLRMCVDFTDQNDIDEDLYEKAFCKIRDIFYSGNDYGNAVFSKAYKGVEEDAG